MCHDVRAGLRGGDSERDEPFACEGVKDHPSGVYDDAELKALQTAFDEACDAARLHHDSPHREALACVFMRLAQSGSRDFEDLKRMIGLRARQMALDT